MKLVSHKLELPNPKRSARKLALPKMGVLNPIVQFKAATLSASAYEMTLDNPVGTGHVLMAFCMYGLENEALPTDTKSNTWQQAPTIEGTSGSPAWYAQNVGGGPTTISFSNVAEVDPQWFIVIEIAAWTEYDTFNLTANDPPVEEEVSLTTSADNDLIVAVFAGHNFASAPPSGWTPGDESIQLDNEVVPYVTDDDWGVIVEYQQAGPAGAYTSTATYDDSLSEFSFAMAIAFKGFTPPIGGFRPGPLSMSNFVPFEI